MSRSRPGAEHGRAASQGDRAHGLGRRLAFILVEQHAELVLNLTKDALVIERGSVARCGASSALLADHASLDRFIGLNLAEGEA
jgi:branched-chain amino acid transport system ATP-binding protein